MPVRAGWGGDAAAAEPVAGGGRIALVTAIVFLAALIPAFASSFVSLVPATGIAIAVGIVIGCAARLRDRLAVSLALVPLTMVLWSLLVPQSGRFLPFGAALVAALIVTGRAVRAGELRVQLPSRSVLVILVAYLVWAAVTTVTSESRLTSALYLAGVGASLLAAFVVLPTVARDATGRRALLSAIAATGMLVAAIGGLLLLSGPVTLFGRTLGQFQVTELVIRAHATGVIVPRVSGPFAATSEPAAILATAVIALAVLAGSARGGRRVLLVLVAILLVVATAVTMSRGGLGAEVGGLVALGLFALLRRRFDLASFGLAALAAVATACLVLGVVGIITRPDLAAERDARARIVIGSAAVVAASPSPGANATPGPSPVASPSALPSAEASATPSTAPGASATHAPVATPAPDDDLSDNVRGGTGLQGRDVLWKASIEAIRAHPIFGTGLGTVTNAIKPWLDQYWAPLGLSSHNTLLRTGVEMGVPGALLYLLTILAVVVETVRRATRGRFRASAEPASVEASGSGTGRAVADRSFDAFIAIAAALVFVQVTESLLLGGLNYLSFAWMVAMGMLVARPLFRSGPGDERRAEQGRGDPGHPDRRHGWASDRGKMRS